MDYARYAFKLGSVDCLVIADAINPNMEERIRSVFNRDPEPIPQRLARGLRDPQSDCRNILVLALDGQRVLIDAGQGELAPDKPGELPGALDAEGIARDTITTIIITHFDGDHIGGLLNGNGKPAFDRARLVVPAPAYDYWMDADTLSTVDPARADLLRRTFAAYEDRLQILASDAEILPGVRYVPAFGHKPGQCAVLIESAGERLIHAADAIHMVAQLNVLESIPRFDLQPELAIATRRALIERVERENLLMLAYHFTFPGVGHVRRDGERRVWQPLDQR